MMPAKIKVSIIRKYRNHTADRPQHHEKEPHNINTNSHKVHADNIKVEQPTLSSLAFTRKVTKLSNI